MKKNSESSFLNKLRLRVLAGFFLMLAVLVSLTGCAPQKDLVIKNGKKTIPERAYFDNKTLESVSMPDTVTSIGREAFRGCTSLMSVTLSEGLTEIGDRAFSSCRNLTSIVIPPSVKSIGFEAFKYCSSLTTVVLCEGLTEIGKGAFEGCNNLTSILIPDTVISVGSMAFYGCSSLNDFTLTSNAVYDNTFLGSADITRLTITGDKMRGDLLWELNESDTSSTLESVTLSDTVTTIQDRAFVDCRKLKSVQLSDAITSIGALAFGGCVELTSISIPDTTVEIGPKAFSGSGLTSVIIPDSVTVIREGAFNACAHLTEVTIPDSVVSIGDEAFRDCEELTSVVIPNTVTSIGEKMFKNCRKLSDEVFGRFPRSFKDAEDARNHTGRLIPEGARVVPMGRVDFYPELELLNGSMYSLMPENVRTADWFTADYALMMEVGSMRTDDYWIIERNSSGVSINSSSVPVFKYYLCGCDGSVRLIYQGGSEYAEDVWNNISKWL